MKDRRFVRFYKKNKEKELLRLFRRYEELREAASTPIEIQKLDKPLKVGYSKTFILNPIGLIQKNLKFIKEALEVCNNVHFSRDKSFKDNIYSPNYLSLKYYNRRQMEDLKLIDIYERVYEKLSEGAKLLFERLEESYSPWAGRTIYKYSPTGIKYSWLSIKIKPEYITEFKIYDNELQSERDKLYNYLLSNDYFNKIYHIIYGTATTDKWYKEKRKFIKRGNRKKENDELRRY